MRPAQAGSNARIVGKHYEVDSVSGSQTKRYYAGGQLLATRTGTTLRYVQPDHLGSTTTLTDEWGVVVSRERYAAFGERRRTSDTLITDQLYTSQRLNVLSGLYHYSDGTSAGRFYDPLLGRFVQADSVTPGNTSIALNRYAYANNSPVRYNDPNGHCPVCVVVVIAAASVGIDYIITTRVAHQEYTPSDAAITAVTSVVGGGLAAGAAKASGVAVGRLTLRKLAVNAALNAGGNALANTLQRSAKAQLRGQPILEATSPSDLAVDAIAGGASGLLGPIVQDVVDAGFPEAMFRRTEGRQGILITQLSELDVVHEGRGYTVISGLGALATDASTIPLVYDALTGALGRAPTEEELKAAVQYRVYQVQLDPPVEKQEDR